MGGVRNRNRKSTLTIGDLVSRYELSNIIEGKSPKTITGIPTSCARSKLFDEICKLLSWSEEQGRITGPTGTIMGVPLPAMNSPQEVTILPRGSSLTFCPLTFL